MGTIVSAKILGCLTNKSLVKEVVKSFNGNSNFNINISNVKIVNSAIVSAKILGCLTNKTLIKAIEAFDGNSNFNISDVKIVNSIIVSPTDIKPVMELYPSAYALGTELGNNNASDSSKLVDCYIKITFKCNGQNKYVNVMYSNYNCYEDLDIFEPLGLSEMVKSCTTTVSMRDADDELSKALIRFIACAYGGWYIPDEQYNVAPTFYPRPYRLALLRKECMNSGIVASETLRACLKMPQYADTKDGEIEAVLRWSGDNQYVTAKDIREEVK